MKFRMKKITALMAAAVLGASTFGGVSVMAAESTEAMAVPADQAGMVVDDDAVAAEGDAIPSDFIQGTFKPSETTVQAQDSYEYPFLGLNMKLPEELLKQIKAQIILDCLIEHFGNADAVPQPPERCLSRQAGIVRCCLRATINRKCWWRKRWTKRR